MLQEMIIEDYGLIERMIVQNQKELDEIGQGGQAMRYVVTTLSDELSTTTNTSIYTSITITSTIISAIPRNYTVFWQHHPNVHLGRMTEGAHKLTSDSITKMDMDSLLWQIVSHTTTMSIAVKWE